MIKNYLHVQYYVGVIPWNSPSVSNHTIYSTKSTFKEAGFKHRYEWIQRVSTSDIGRENPRRGAALPKARSPHDVASLASDSHESFRGRRKDGIKEPDTEGMDTRAPTTWPLGVAAFKLCLVTVCSSVV